MPGSNIAIYGHIMGQEDTAPVGQRDDLSTRVAE
jgi:hypothetical protein